jgi:hypothetical protein
LRRHGVGVGVQPEQAGRAGAADPTCESTFEQSPHIDVRKPSLPLAAGAVSMADP